MSQPIATETEPSASSATFPSLRGKRVFMTGGATGIGSALVQAFARQGARVAFVDIATSPSTTSAIR